MDNNLNAIKAMLGSVFDTLMDPGVVEISLNPSLDVFVEYFGREPEFHTRMERDVAERFIRYCASKAETTITKDNPILSARVPGLAHRIEALLPPVVDAPSFSIRRHSEHIIPLNEYVQDDVALGYIKNAIETKKSILIAGSTGSGKTTLANGCLDYLAQIAPATRMIVLEDTPEIQSPLKNAVLLKSSDTVSMDRLLVSSLRLAPDRIIVGEVRTGGVLMTLLKAWNSGHPGGITTIHANSAQETLPKLRLLYSEVSVSDQSEFILSALDMIVFVERGYERPDVKNIISINKTKTTPKVEIIYEHV